MGKLSSLTEGVDWYIDPETGKHILTYKFLLDRGFCCFGQCKHCPYDELGSVKPDHKLIRI